MAAGLAQPGCGDKPNPDDPPAGDGGTVPSKPDAPTPTPPTPKPPTPNPENDAPAEALSFETRLKYHRAQEKARHAFRTGGAKRPFDATYPPGTFADKVRLQMAKAQVLKEKFDVVIKRGDLLAEMKRINEKSRRKAGFFIWQARISLVCEINLICRLFSVSAIHQLHKCHRCIVALAKAIFEYTQVTTIAFLISGSEFIEKLDHNLTITQP